MRPLPSATASPSPQSRLPSEPGSSREVSAVWPAQPRGMRTQPGPQQGLSQVPPGLVDRRMGGGGETRPYPTRRLLLRRPPFAVPEAPPPGPPQPPCPRPPRPLLTWEQLLPPSAPPPAPPHRPAEKPNSPIGPAAGGEGVLPFLEAPPGLFTLPRESAPAPSLHSWRWANAVLCVWTRSGRGCDCFRDWKQDDRGRGNQAS